MVILVHAASRVCVRWALSDFELVIIKGLESLFSFELASTEFSTRGILFYVVLFRSYITKLFYYLVISYRYR